jgi:hypothetical protein
MNTPHLLRKGAHRKCALLHRAHRLIRNGKCPIPISQLIDIDFWKSFYISTDNRLRMENYQVDYPTKKSPKTVEFLIVIA